MLLYNLDTLVVGRVLGMTSLGFYDKAFSTMNRLVNRLTLGQAYFRIFSIIHEEPLRFRRAYSKLVLTISVIGLPAFAAAIVVAEPLFILMYGEKWVAAVLPFQMLCVGGILKLLNAYASQANEATGNIWPQVRRQALGAVSIVVGAFLGARMGGVTGAAIGVAIGMAIMTVAMQVLIRRVTGLTWGEMLRPQVPGAAGATLVVAALLAVQYSMAMVVQQPAAWQMFLAQTIVGTLVYGLFLLLNPFADLNAIVSESVDQLLPEKLAARVERVRRSRVAPSR